MTRGICALLLVAALVAGCERAPATPPPSAEPSTSPSGPLSGTTIVVDPGHNGGNADHADEISEKVDVVTGTKPCNTVGAVTDDGYSEHEFNFAVAELLIETLRESGATVVETRDSDDGVGPCVDERAAIGNEAGADAVVSIHADGGPQDGRGFHIMKPVELKGHTEDIVEPSHSLAENLATAIADTTPMPPSDYIGDDGLNPRDDMGGLNLSRVPAVMVECGNMANGEDSELLRDGDFREQLAAALAAGTTEFLQVTR